MIWCFREGEVSIGLVEELWDWFRDKLFIVIKGELLELVVVVVVWENNIFVVFMEMVKFIIVVEW